MKTESVKQKYIYVCLSEYKDIVKVGISYNVPTRVGCIKTTEGQTFDLLFCSKLTPLDKCLEVEREVNNKFKNDIVKGKEWYKTKPLLIIEFLMGYLNIEPFEIGEITTEFESWEENYSKYITYKPSLEFPPIKEKQTKGLYSIAYIDKDEFKYRGFCNYGDAKKFYYEYKVFVVMANNILKDLYGLNIESLKTLQIPLKKDIYTLRSKVVAVKEKLEGLIKLTNF